ncbi:hypothetical protein C8R42DRAFT_532089, partial [Lentinula raphanica]
PAPRTTRHSSSILNNSFRPNVQAKDRLYAWSSPFTLARQESESLFIPANVRDQAERIQAIGHADSTKTSYAAGLLRFHQFCDSNGIPEEHRIPAHPTLILGFIGTHSGSVSGRTIKSWLSGIRAWHILHGAEWPDDPRIGLARSGANIEGSKHTRPLRNPVTIQHMLALYASLDLSIPFHCAIWAVATSCFWGCRRLGELTIKSSSVFNPSKHVTRKGSISDYITSSSQKRLKFHIPWTKTTKELGADVVASSQLNCLCPCDAFALHWTVNANVPEGFSLFAFVDGSGSPCHMLKSIFLKFVKEVWDRAGLSNVLGHSFRIGGAVELLLAGVPPHVVAAIGGWTSLAFLTYWRKLEEILLVQVGNAYKEKWTTLKQSMDNFRKDNNI